MEECIERIPCDDIEVKKESNWNKAYTTSPRTETAASTIREDNFT